jgi:hypothetical protein
MKMAKAGKNLLGIQIGHSRKHPYLPQRRLEVNPPTSFGRPKYTSYYHIAEVYGIRNKFSASPSGQQKFPLWGECGSFLK